MRTILLVDDNSDIVTLLQMILKQQGYQVITGRNGQEGMRLLERSEPKPDLIISNYYMPHMNGLVFLEQVRRQPQYEHIPFIMLSAAAGTQWQEQATDLGANGFLPKPFKIDLLKNTLSTIPNLCN
ncbi:MAG: response regulator [Anaerolineae bacterium]